MGNKVSKASSASPAVQDVRDFKGALTRSAFENMLFDFFDAENLPKVIYSFIWEVDFPINFSRQNFSISDTIPIAFVEEKHSFLTFVESRWNNVVHFEIKGFRVKLNVIACTNKEIPSPPFKTFRGTWSFNGLILIIENEQDVYNFKATTRNEIKERHLLIELKKSMKQRY